MLCVMRKDVKLKLWGLGSVFVLVGIFLVLSYFVQNNMEFFERMVSDNYWGLLVFILLNFVGIVVAPVTVIPLVVIVTSIWGGLVASIATLIAWTLGLVVAFLIARKLGVPIVSKFISMDELYKFEERFSFIGSFWGVVFLRMVIPVEILSYGLGLFSRIGFWKYTFASVLGLLPVCFSFGYLGMIAFVYQIVLGLLVLDGILIGMIFMEVWHKGK